MHFGCVRVPDRGGKAAGGEAGGAAPGAGGRSPEDLLAEEEAPSLRDVFLERLKRDGVENTPGAVAAAYGLDVEVRLGGTVIGRS